MPPTGNRLGYRSCAGAVLPTTDSSSTGEQHDVSKSQNISAPARYGDRTESRVDHGTLLAPAA
jgi:hypothetical protein